MRERLYSRRKENTYVLTKVFSFGKKDAGNMGLLRGRNISNLFERLVGRDSIDFNALPIPFACVATDIVDNTEYDFHSGRLALAMRASMAIPAAFSPVRLGSHLFVDGGLRNNYPADLAREMGADIIIGVCVQEEAKTADEIVAGGSVLSQIVDVNCKNKFVENWAMTDVKIRVNVKGFNTVSFTPEAIDTLICRGEEETLRHWDELQAVKAKLGGEDALAAEWSARKAVATEALRAMDEESSAAEDDLTLQEPSWSLGVRFDSEERVALQGNLYIPFRTKIPTDIDLTLRLGKRMMGRADFVGHRFTYMYRRDEINIYNGGTKAFNFTYNQHVIQLLPLRFSVHHFAFEIGARFDYYDIRDLLINQQTKYDGLTIGNDHLVSYGGRVIYNSEDSWYFPMRGTSFHAQYAYHTDNFAQLNGRTGLSDVSAQWRVNIPLSSRFALQPMVYGRLLYGDERPVYLCNMVGGPSFGHYVEQQLPFAGVGHMEHMDPHFIAAQLQGLQRIKRNNYVMLQMAVAQNSVKLKDIFDNRMKYGVQMVYAYNTIFGPLGVSLGYSNQTDKGYMLINLGHEF